MSKPLLPIYIYALLLFSPHGSLIDMVEMKDTEEGNVIVSFVCMCVLEFM